MSLHFKLEAIVNYFESGVPIVLHNITICSKVFILYICSKVVVYM